MRFRYSFEKSALLSYYSSMNINSKHCHKPTFVKVEGYCNSNYCMVRTNRTNKPTYSIINIRTNEFLTSGITRDHAVRLWNRTGIYHLGPMVCSS